MHVSALPSPINTQLEQLENRAVQAFRDQDARVMEELHDEQCVGVGILGTQYDKGEFIDAFRDKLVVESIDLLSTNVVLEDSFAVVLSNWNVNMALGASIFNGRVRVTRTWVKRGQGWKIISFHFSDARLAATWEKIKSGKGNQ